MQWPSCQDYNEAVQYPDISFEDSELRAGKVELTPLGLPKAATGNFATVYRFDCGDRRYGVKCFNRNVYDQHQRYALLSQFTAVTDVPNMVDFDYQLKGICVDGNWFPIVKMDWVEGVGLDQFLRKNWSNKSQIDRVIDQFIELVERMQNVRMAHGDLQHGNIMVQANSVKLVDYDGIFVPAMQGNEASELGHPNYQHPHRSVEDFAPRLDDFSAWIIYYSLLFLKLDPSLWQRYEGGDDCLIFRKTDFVDPARSRLMSELARHPIPEIKSCYEHLDLLLHRQMRQVPKFVRPSAASSLTSNQVTPPRAHRQESDSEPRADVVQSSGDTRTEQTAPTVPVPSKFPSAESYFKALKTPTRSLFDDNLNKSLMCATFGYTSTELQIHAANITFKSAVIPGKRNVVFRMALIDGSRYYAVKCFLQPEAERQIRYDAIKRHKLTESKRFFTQFLYQPRGITVGSEIFPIVKMLWVEGETIDQYASRKVRLGDFDAVEALQTQFRQMLRALAEDGIAHGDLEPRNILVDVNDKIKLIDYDAMYVPALAQLQSCDIGVEGYQHPNRNLTNFGPYLDNYSAVIIDHLLTCMLTNPPEKLHNWDLLLQHVKNKAILKRQSSAALPLPKKKSSATPMDSLDLFKPQISSFRPDPAVQQESKFETEVTKFANKLQDMSRYRLDLIPPLWNRTHNPT